MVALAFFLGGIYNQEVSQSIADIHFLSVPISSGSRALRSINHHLITVETLIVCVLVVPTTSSLVPISEASSTVATGVSTILASEQVPVLLAKSVVSVLNERVSTAMQATLTVCLFSKIVKGGLGVLGSRTSGPAEEVALRLGATHGFHSHRKDQAIRLLKGQRLPR